jgi:RHS repeat-associated protein
VTRVDGTSAGYTYDDLGQVATAVGYEPNGTTLRANENFTYSYDPAANLLGRQNNTLIQSFQSDNANQLVNVALDNNLVTAAGSLPNAVTSLSVNGQAAALYHDLTFAVAGGVSVNILQNNGLNEFTTVVTSAGVTQTSVNPELVPGSVNLRYDANGNLAYDGLLAYTYDNANELASVTLSNAWKTGYAYDGLGRRRIRRDYAWSGGAWAETNEVHYVYDGLTVIQERNANNVPLVTYTRGLDLSGTASGAGGIGGLLARTDANGNSYYHTDGNGNVTALVNGSGTVVARYLYDSFGNPLGMWGSLATANTQRFSSKEVDPHSGLYYYGYRWYAPNLQRWLNRDPIGEMGGLNLYDYVGNNPINLFDPFGLIDTGPQGGYVDPFGNWHMSFCMSCHDNTPAGNFYRDQSMLANNQSWGVFAYQQGFGLSLGLVGGGLADEMMMAQEMNSVRQLGQAGERCAGITGPKTRIPSLTGTAAYRIPDELTLNTLREIKNVANLNRVTGQLQDFSLFAQQSQRQFTLEIRQNTVIAPTVDQYLQLNQVNVIRSLPPQ